jgi:hypothetical protein
MFGGIGQDAFGGELLRKPDDFAGCETTALGVVQLEDSDSNAASLHLSEV